MNLRASALALLLCLTPSVVAPVGRAVAADDAATRTARARFQEGVAAYDRGQYDAARVAFLQAYSLRRHPAVLLNLAMSCLKAGHSLEASKYFQQYLREAKDASPAQRESANQGLAEARTHLGRIDVQAPAGTEVAIDDERAGTAPFDDAIDVEPGTHSVRLRGEGREETQTVSVRAGDRATARLTPAPASPSTPPTPAEPAPVATTSPSNVEPTSPPPAGEGSGSADSSSSHASLLAPPESMTPVWIASGLALAGLGVGIAFGIQRNVAQENADKVEQQIRDAGGTAGSCSSTDPRVVAAFGEACAVLADNRNITNVDATVATTGFIVAGASAAFAVGWYLFSDKAEAASGDAPASARRPRLQVTPLAGFHQAGLLVAGTLP